MQNSVSEGAPFESTNPIAGTAPFGNEVASSSLENNSSPNFTSETPAYSYDEVFPALPQNITQPSTVTNHLGYPNNKMRIGSSIVTQVFTIPYDERKLDSSEKFGESESLRICLNISQATGATIETSTSKDQSLTFLVSGKAPAVSEARKKILSHFQTQAVVKLNIPKEHHKCLLGKGGQRLKDLEKATGCKITVPIIADPSDAITIVGPKEGIEKAVHEIKVTSDEQSKQAYERISIPKMYHPFICGGYNERLNQLIQETNVRINVPPPSVQKNEITIAGEKEGVQLAKQRIMAIHKEMEKKCFHISVEIPKSQHKFVIGFKRNTIAEILQKTGVSVEMPTADSQKDTITLRGPQDKLGSALNMVYDKANGVLETTVSAPGWIHKHIIGRKGANIKKITQDLPKVHVEFTEKENKINIEGPPEEVEKVQKELEEVVKEYQYTLTYEEIAVDPKFHKHIIGKGGANVTRLKEESGVSINFKEEDGNATNIIRIEGTHEGVSTVKKKLEEIVSKLENKTEKVVNIDYRLHYLIIGTKGEKIKEIREMFPEVIIKFLTMEKKNDAVQVKGPKDEVEKCCKYLTKLAKELLEENFVLEVPIHKQFHKFVIGKEGANIKKIRTETSTKIDLPGEDDSSDLIVITGRKENVYQAKERIEKIQNELSATIFPKLLNNVNSSDDSNDKSGKRGKDDKNKADGKKDALVTAQVKAKLEYHKFLIGKNGANVRRIRESTNTIINFPIEKSEDKETIIISGQKEQVEKAKEEFVKAIRELEKVTETEMSVDPIYHKRFVSKRAALIHQITEECGGNITISFPRPNEDSDKVILKGPKECVEMAKKKIEETVNDLKSIVTISCVIPQKLHRIVMGTRGSKVQRITSLHNVQINFPDRDSQEEAQPSEGSNGMVNGEEPVRSCDVIKITGKPENCEAAKEAILKLVPITIEVPVAVDLHGYIIGKSGGAVRQMMEGFDVHISVSPADQKLDCIKITGAPENVEKAKEALEERVRQLEKEKEERILKSFSLFIEVDPEYHPKIIGKGGAVITKIRNDYGVQIILPKRGDPDEHTIKIQGYEEKAKAARDHILDIVNKLKERIKEEVVVDHRVHSRLIGPKGRAIRKFMDEYGVEIKFPRQGSTEDVVTIIGTEENVLEAKDQILNLAEEYMMDIMDSYIRTPSYQFTIGESRGQGDSGGDGFVVRGGPWEQQQQEAAQRRLDTASIQDFPSIGNSGSGEGLSSHTITWGPRPR